MSVDSRPQVSTLDNGLQLVLSELPHARSVSISIYIRAGQRYEAAPADAGISHFVEHLCFKGTERRPSPRLVAVEIDGLGGSINAATDRELTVYYAKVTPDRFAEALDLLADMLRGSQCREEEIERERRVILEELASVEDTPDEQASVLLDGLLWPGEPLGRDIAGAPASIGALGADRLRDYYRGQYVANSAVISIAGGVPAGEAREQAMSVFADWPAGEPLDWVRAGEAPDAPGLRLLEKETEQAHLALGLRGLHSLDEDRHALALLSIALGEGMSSRLFLRLREELGLCYDVHSAASYLLDTGAFSVHAGVDPANAVETVREIVASLACVRSPIEPAELERAKQVVRSRIQLQLEDTRSVSAWHGSRLALGLPLRQPEEAIAGFEEVTLADVERVAQRLVRGDRLQLAAVGPIADAAAIEEALQLAD